MPPLKRKEVDPTTLLPPRLTRAAAKRAAAGESSGPAEKKTKVTKKGKQQQQQQKKQKKEAKEKEKEEEEGVSSSKTIIIEHCKQCNSFKTRANQVKEGLEKKASGVTVILNPEKPRRGCFEIREEGEGGKKFITLLDMKRPFTPMKKLDMEKVISDIVDEISTTGG